MCTCATAELRSDIHTLADWDQAECHLLAGGGAWGTALAIHAAKMGHKTLLWAREPEVVASVNGPTRENTTFLKVRL